MIITSEQHSHAIRNPQVLCHGEISRLLDPYHWRKLRFRQHAPMTLVDIAVELCHGFGIENICHCHGGWCAIYRSHSLQAYVSCSYWHRAIISSTEKRPIKLPVPAL